MFEVAGSFGPILLGLGGLGALLAAVFAVVGILGKRVPLLAWLLMPAVITAVGAFASLTATGSIGDTLTGDGDIGAMSSGALSAAYGARWLAHWVVAVLSAFSVWCAAISALVKPGGETRSTLFVAVMAALVSILSPIGTLIFAMGHGLGSQALLLIGLVSFAGLGCALIAFRRALHEAAFRLASLRFSAGILMIFTTAQAIRALILYGHMERLLVRATTVHEEIVPALTEALAMQANIETLSWIMLAVGAAIALFTFLGEMAEVVDKFALVDFTAVSVLLLSVGGLRSVERMAEDTMTQTTNMYPLGELVSTLGFQLPAASVAGYTSNFDVHITDAPIGDIITYGVRPSYVPPPAPDVAPGEPAYVAPPAPRHWYRAFVWNGSSWDRDDTLVEDISAADGYTPLIAAPGSTGSDELIPLLKKFGGSAHLLLRVSEMTPQIAPELAYTEADWITVRLTGAIDYTTDSYAMTERYDPYIGAARYIGTQRRNDKAVHRIDKMISETGVTAIRATTSEKVRLDHIVSLCLNTKVIPGAEPELDDVEEPPTLRDGFECSIVEINIDDAIAGAVAAVGMPTADNATLAVTLEPGLDPAAAPAVERELAAFGACAGQVADDMGMTTAITGRLAGSFTIDDRGRAGRFEFEQERRDIEIFDMKLCVRDRLEWARFPAYEHPTPPVQLDEEGNEIEVEPIPLPRVQFVLNYR